MLSRQPPSQNVPISESGRHLRHPRQAQNAGKSSSSGVLPLREADARSPPPPGRCKAGARKEKPGEIGVSDCTALGTFLAAPGRNARKRQREFSFISSHCYCSSCCVPRVTLTEDFRQAQSPCFQFRPRCQVGGAGGGGDDSQAGRNGDLEA